MPIRNSRYEGKGRPAIQTPPRRIAGNAGDKVSALKPQRIRSANTTDRP
jgi:hypothetical protein